MAWHDHIKKSYTIPFPVLYISDSSEVKIVWHNPLVTLSVLYLYVNVYIILIPSKSTPKRERSPILVGVK